MDERLATRFVQSFLGIVTCWVWREVVNSDGVH